MELHSKDRFKKVDITDIAIKKVQRISYKGLTEDQNALMCRLVKMTLLRALTENDSNEVAITIDLESPDGEQGFTKGDEHSVDIGASPASYHLLRAGMKVVVIHNHPSTQTLSIEDIALFLRYELIKYIVVVTNQGTVHYMMKDEGFDFSAAERLRLDCCADLTKDSPVKDFYNAALDFLAHCSEVGLYYR